MKKLLALVLALIMVLGLGVTAFADVKVIELQKEIGDDDELEEIVFLEDEIVPERDAKTNKKVYLAGPNGGDFYLPINKTNLKNIEVSATGNVTAEIVKFDGETMRYPGVINTNIRYYVVDSNTTARTAGKDSWVPEDSKKFINVEYTFNTAEETADADGAKAVNMNVNMTTPTGEDVEHIIYWAAVEEYFKANATAARADALVAGATAVGKLNETLGKLGANAEWTYEYAEIIADALNDALRTSRFSVVAFEKSAANAPAGTPDWVKLKKDLLKVTVAENYSAAYKEGTVKITATRDKKAVVANLTIISDVIIFEYEEVKWAGDNKALTIGTKGYSDYKTAKKGYGPEYVESALREYDGATVVSTTAFRAIEGEELEVTTGDKAITVTIDEVAKGQKGVNFACEGPIYYDEDDEKLTAGAEKGKVEYFEFGFLGDQVIASDFEIEVKLGYDYYDLREKFGKKVEEEDIITYYVLKDGVKIDEFTVDYKDDDIDDDVELEILGKAGDKLGYYTVTLDAPAAEEGEENPNTGAESVVGVVAAMAVISLATAAAVSLKK